MNHTEQLRGEREKVYNNGVDLWYDLTKGSKIFNSCNLSQYIQLISNQSHSLLNSVFKNLISNKYGQPFPVSINFWVLLW